MTDQGPPKFAVLAGLFCGRNPDGSERWDVGTYGLCASRDAAEQLVTELTQTLGEHSRPCIIPIKDYRAFDPLHLWREAQGVAV